MTPLRQEVLRTVNDMAEKHRKKRIGDFVELYGDAIGAIVAEPLVSLDERLTIVEQYLFSK